MKCFLCGKEIGFLRRLVDRQYCSSEHRHKARFASARALRDAEEDEPWSVLAAKKKAGKSGATAGQTASLFGFLAVTVVIAVIVLMPSSGGGGGIAIPMPSPEQGKPAGLLARAADYVASGIKTNAPISLRDDFRTGLKDWAAAPIRSGGGRSDVFGTASDSALPGSLRIWKRSTSMANYQMEFQGQIEKRSLAWAFRASDNKNFYATKLVMTKPGPLPNAGLVRYAMVDGQEFDRIQIPLPVVLEKGGSYRIRLSVQDDRFVTSLNGQVVSSWSDRRLRRGGVGFFAEEGEQASVKWVTLAERDSFLGRVLAHFSLFVMPGFGADLEQ